MKKNHTDITICADRSGSMQSIASDTIGGFNTFLADQKTAPGTASITLHLFDHDFETPINNQDIQEAPELTNKTFVPRGSTALLDAIGRAIVETGVRLEKDPAEKVVFVIITDGYENTSKEYTRDKIFEMITHQKEKYNWEFVFLGASQDAISIAQSYGVNAGSSMSYAANSKGVSSLFGCTSSNLRSMRAGETLDMCYSETDRAEQEAAK